MSQSVRLRPLVEVIDDGQSLFLLRGPGGGDCRIAAPSAATAAAVTLLQARAWTPAQLQRSLERRGLLPDAGEMRQLLEGLEHAELLEREPVAPCDERLSRQYLYLRDRCPRGADPAEMHAALRRARVLIVGCGGLGSWAAAGLVCVGVGGLTLVDGDVVEHSNLNRQLLFRESDVGRPKVLAAAESLRAFDRSLAVTPVQRYLDTPSAVGDALAGHDFVVACADQPAYEIARWINDACLAAGVPHISAGQLPPIVRVGPTVLPGVTGCLRCLEAALREENPLYDRLEAARRDDRREQSTVGPASGIAGQVIAMEILHQLTGLAPPATGGAVWTLDLRTLTSETTAVARRAGCPACGETASSAPM